MYKGGTLKRVFPDKAWLNECWWVANTIYCIWNRLLIVYVGVNSLVIITSVR